MDKVESLREMERELYHIHSIADVLNDIGTGCGGIEITGTNNKTSNPLDSLMQIIKEKVEKCLGMVWEMQSEKQEVAP